MESNRRVYPERSHGFGIWGNRRVPMTIRVDEGLKKSFSEFSKRVFGSTCLPLECVMASLLTASVELEKAGVYPHSTIQIDFEKILIERNTVRTRRNMVFESEFKSEPVASCEFRGCHNAAVVVAEYVGPSSYRGKQFHVCQSHLETDCSNRLLWKICDVHLGEALE